MPEWLIEGGVGETRAALIDHGRIIEARIELEGSVPAGTILPARIVDVGTGGRNGIARDRAGIEYLLRSVPRGIPEGSQVAIEITRPAIPGPERWKRPLARLTNEEPREARTLEERLRSDGTDVRCLTFPSPSDALGEAGWEELIDEARISRTDFFGGSLGLFSTPAMTLVDVDGHLPPFELAIAGASAAAQAVQRLDIGGSIGIDLPTVADRKARIEAAEVVDSTLPKPFERTAVNGFGFLQIVRPRRRPSLLELAQDRAAFEARALLRRAALDRAGAMELAAHPAVIAVLKANPGWMEALSRQVGGAVSLRSDSSLPIHGSYAENG